MSWTSETNIKGPPGPPGGIGEAPTDGQTYGRKNTAWSVVASGGDVTGPAGAVADRIAVFNGATGKVIKDGGTLVSDLALVASPSFTGDPKAPTPATADNDTSIATTAFVKAQGYAASASVPVPATATPIGESGTGAVGSSVKYAREDHVHPLVGGGGGASVSVSDTPPVGAADNSLWFESDTLASFIRYNDGSSSQWVPFGNATPAPPVPGHLWGLTLSTAGATATFGVAAGVATNSTNVAGMTLASAYTKTTGAWAVGSGNGALDTGAIAASTWYHVFLIRRPDTSVVDVLVSLSPTAPTLPANYTQSRRIGSMKTNASSQWTKFIQDGDLFTWDVPVNDVPIVNNPGTAAVTRILASVPLGIRVRARIFAAIQATVIGYPGGFLVSDLAVADTPASVTAASIYFYNNVAATVVFGAPFEVMTNTAAQVRTRFESSNAGTNLYIDTIGWFDNRGRDA